MFLKKLRGAQELIWHTKNVNILLAADEVFAKFMTKKRSDSQSSDGEAKKAKTAGGGAGPGGGGEDDTMGK